MYWLRAEWKLFIQSFLSNVEAGDIPILLDKSNQATIEMLAQENVKISQTDWDSYESSWDFQRHPLVWGVSMKIEIQNYKKSINESQFTLAQVAMIWDFYVTKSVAASA